MGGEQLQAWQDIGLYCNRGISLVEGCRLWIDVDYRLIPRNTPANELVMSHISTNLDRTGYQQDLNVVFPLDPLNGLVQQGKIESLAKYHYFFMGATEPEKMESAIATLSAVMKKDGVNAVLLAPV